MKLKRAVKTLQKHLKKDAELRNGYKANIAVAFQDEFKTWSEDLADKDVIKNIHEISNQAAERFLNNFCHQY